MKKILFIILLFPLTTVFSQSDSAKINQDAAYNRPFINIGKTRTAVGGYVEGNTNYFSEDGVSEGFSMELRRFNIFIYSKIHDRIKFLSEVEFEHGTEEIALENAQLDFEINPSLIFRGGILLPQIGLVNANHDSPKWDFVERPLSSTEIIPSTLSEVGFGLLGKFYPGGNVLGYHAYIVNGLRDEIILNSEGKTHLESGKNEEMFGEDNNGVPMFNAKVSFSNDKAGEFGLSYYGGVYNTFKLEGTVVDKKRNLSLYAFDYSNSFGKFSVKSEFAFAQVDVPADIDEIYGTRQYGTFLELGYTFLKRKMIFEDASLSAHFRGEMTDYNLGTFDFNGSKIGDEAKGFSVGISFRPTAGTVVRANYLYRLIYDNLGNSPTHLGGFQFGIASYF